MATIYNFHERKLVYALRSFSRQSKTLSSRVSGLVGLNNVMNDHVSYSASIYRDFYSRLEILRLKLNKSVLNTQACLKACDSNSIDEMIKLRKKVSQKSSRN